MGSNREASEDTIFKWEKFRFDLKLLSSKKSELVLLETSMMETEVTKVMEDLFMKETENLKFSRKMF